MSDWIKPGAEVVVLRGSISEHARMDKIAKVHKTGRFTLVGFGTQQFSLVRDGVAMSTARGLFNLITVKPLTDDLKANLLREEEKRARASYIQDVSVHLAKVVREGDYEQIAMVARSLKDAGFVA